MSDRVTLDLAAIGNHQGGYRGMVRVHDQGAREWVCPHVHATSSEARDCARRSIADALRAVRVL